MYDSQGNGGLRLIDGCDHCSNRGTNIGPYDKGKALATLTFLLATSGTTKDVVTVLDCTAAVKKFHREKTDRFFGK